MGGRVYVYESPWEFLFYTPLRVYLRVFLCMLVHTHGFTAAALRKLSDYQETDVALVLMPVSHEALRNVCSLPHRLLLVALVAAAVFHDKAKRWARTQARKVSTSEYTTTEDGACAGHHTHLRSLGSMWTWFKSWASRRPSVGRGPLSVVEHLMIYHFAVTWVPLVVR